LQEQGITDGDAGYAVANKLAEKTKIAKKGELTVSETEASITRRERAKQAAINAAIEA